MRHAIINHVQTRSKLVIQELIVDLKNSLNSKVKLY